jgi:hypothetical protein
MEIILVFLSIASIMLNVMFFNILTDNQKLILDEIEKLKN